MKMQVLSNPTLEIFVIAKSPADHNYKFFFGTFCIQINISEENLTEFTSKVCHTEGQGAGDMPV